MTVLTRHDISLIVTTDGSDFKGERLTVQFARGPRRKEAFPGPPDRNAVPRPRRTVFRMQISGLPETSWQVSSPSPFPPGCPGVDSSSPSLFSARTCFQSMSVHRLGRGSSSTNQVAPLLDWLAAGPGFIS